MDDKIIGKLFQKSIILLNCMKSDEKKLDLTRLIACGLKSLQEVKVSYMRCSKVGSKIDPQVIMIHTVKLDEIRGVRNYSESRRWL